MAAADRLHGLDALRGIAALCVVGLHTGAVFGGFPYFAKGYLAVDFFLMLSGFMMARVTEPRLAAGLDPLRFMQGRYRRFWPIVALGSVIGIPYLWVRAGGAWDPFLPALIANFLLLPWPVANLLFALNIPVWTIFFELVANAVHVLALHRVRTRTIAVLALIALALTIYVAMRFGSLDVGARPATFLGGFPRIFLAYLIGILLWRTRGDTALSFIPGWLAMTALPAAILASWAVGWRHWSFDLAFVLAVCPLTILGALGLRRATRIGWLSAAMSFPLFAVHLPILEAARELGYGVRTAAPLAFALTALIVWWTNRPARRMAAPQA
ncbi:MAG TPA: acyltransferase family protein [Novosphingobium sp.]|nr:acyltransferase family protein [Novosphingobium sp.]